MSRPCANATGAARVAGAMRALAFLLSSIPLVLEAQAVDVPVRMRGAPILAASGSEHAWIVVHDGEHARLMRLAPDGRLHRRRAELEAVVAIHGCGEGVLVERAQRGTRTATLLSSDGRVLASHRLDAPILAVHCEGEAASMLVREGALRELVLDRSGIAPRSQSTLPIAYEERACWTAEGWILARRTEQRTEVVRFDGTVLGSFEAATVLDVASSEVGPIVLIAEAAALVLVRSGGRREIVAASPVGITRARFLRGPRGELVVSYALVGSWAHRQLVDPTTRARRGSARTPRIARTEARWIGAEALGPVQGVDGDALAALAGSRLMLLSAERARGLDR